MVVNLPTSSTHTAQRQIYQTGKTGFAVNLNLPSDSFYIQPSHSRSVLATLDNRNHCSQQHVLTTRSLWYCSANLRNPAIQLCDSLFLSADGRQESGCLVHEATRDEGVFGVLRVPPAKLGEGAMLLLAWKAGPPDMSEQLEHLF